MFRGFSKFFDVARSLHPSVNVVRTTKDVINLNQIIFYLKAEIDKLKQTKNNYSINQNNMTNHYLPPLGPLPRYYN